MSTYVYANWSGANTSCATTTISGQTDWRLPTLDELLSLYNSGLRDGQTGQFSYFTWSSTPDGDGCHYYVGLDVDYVGGVYDTYNNLYVSCVR